MAHTHLTLCAASSLGTVVYDCLTENSLWLLRTGTSVFSMTSMEFYIKPIPPLQRLLQLLGLGTPAHSVASVHTVTSQQLLSPSALRRRRVITLVQSAPSVVPTACIKGAVDPGTGTPILVS